MPGLAFDDGSPVTNEHLKIYELQQERERKTLAERAAWAAAAGPGKGKWALATIVPPVIDGESAFLHQAEDLLPPEPWDDAVWRAWTETLAQTTGRVGEPLLLPLRLALTGEDHGPSLDKLLPLIGRARAANRLRIAAA